MTDCFTKKKRSEVMSRIKGKDTKPELLVRSALHRMGYRFRLHVKDLPGKPDIVLPKYKTVIFVHGCFWHQHKGCPAGHLPKTNKKFWKEKFARNVARDSKHRRQLRYRGWHVLTIWECQIQNETNVNTKLHKLARWFSTD